MAQVAGARGMERAFWKIAMRPGKPLMAGRLGGAVLLGLPGNPVSAIVCAHLFLLPMLRAMQGAPAPAPQTRGATLAEARARAYAMVDAIDWPDGFCRRDIGWRAL